MYSTVETSRGPVGYQVLDAPKKDRGLIYLHGWSGNPLFLNRLDTKYPLSTVVRIHLPNNKGSYYRPGENLRNMTQAVRETIGEFKFDAYSVVGHSVGALIAYNLARQGSPNMDTVVGFSLYTNPQRKSLEHKTWDAAVDHIRNNLRGNSPDSSKYYYDFLLDRLNRRLFRWDFWQSGSQLVAPKATHLEHPVYLIHGKNDRVVTPKELEESLGENDKLHINYVSGDGHSWHRRSPSMLYGFISRNIPQ